MMKSTTMVMMMLSRRGADEDDDGDDEVDDEHDDDGDYDNARDSSSSLSGITVFMLKISISKGTIMTHIKRNESNAFQCDMHFLSHLHSGWSSFSHCDTVRPTPRKCG